MTSYWSKRSLARQRWSRNAVRRKAKLRIDRALAPLAEEPCLRSVAKIKPARFDVRINLERKDGQRLQFTCHRLGGKLMISGARFIAPKQFRRVLGQILELWSQD